VPNVSKAQVMALAEGTEWLDRGANVLLFGPPGVGKSHLVCALGHALIDAGRRVLFTRCCDLVQRLQAARRDLRLPQELAKLDRFDLLILDDLSYVRRDQAETSVLFELIAERYERKSLAITANTPFSQWGEVFADTAMTVAGGLASCLLCVAVFRCRMTFVSASFRYDPAPTGLAQRTRSLMASADPTQPHAGGLRVQCLVQPFGFQSAHAPYSAWKARTSLNPCSPSHPRRGSRQA
jgi:hypothetical protein